MARVGRGISIDFTSAHELAHGLLERASCPTGKEFVLLRDCKKKGLRLRITKVGGKHWQFETRIKGKLFTRSLGEWPAVSIAQAQAEAHRLRGDTERGIDPRVAERVVAAAAHLAEAEKQRIAKFTFAALMADYAEQLEKLGRTSHAKVRGMIRLHLIEGAPPLANTPAAKVTGEQVTDLMRQLNDVGKKRTAGKLRSYARAAFEMARTAGMDAELPVHFKNYGVKHNPAAEVKAIKLDTDKNPLMPVHLRQYWHVIKSIPGQEGAVLRLHLLTGGQRIQQLCNLSVRNVRSEVITLVDRKGRPGNPPRAHQVPLIEAAQDAISELLALSGRGQYVLSLDAGASPLAAASFSRWAKRAAANVAWETGMDVPDVGDFQAKRIRSGVETTLASLRVSQDIRGQLLSHGVTGVQAASYDAHNYLDVKREALQTLFRFLENTNVGVVHTAFPRAKV